MSDEPTQLEPKSHAELVERLLNFPQTSSYPDTDAPDQELKQLLAERDSLRHCLSVCYHDHQIGFPIDMEQVGARSQRLNLIQMIVQPKLMKTVTSADMVQDLHQHYNIMENVTKMLNDGEEELRAAMKEFRKILPTVEAGNLESWIDFRNAFPKFRKSTDIPVEDKHAQLITALGCYRLEEFDQLDRMPLHLAIDFVQYKLNSELFWTEEVKRAFNLRHPMDTSLELDNLKRLFKLVETVIPLAAEMEMVNQAVLKRTFNVLPRNDMLYFIDQFSAEFTLDNVYTFLRLRVRGLDAAVRLFGPLDKMAQKPWFMEKHISLTKTKSAVKDMSEAKLFLNPEDPKMEPWLLVSKSKCKFGKFCRSGPSSEESLEEQSEKYNMLDVEQEST